MVESDGIGGLPAGGGEMGGRIRAFDWSASPLGSPSGWPQVLHTLINLMLASSQPMFLVWGPARSLLYNDAYAQILAGKHPALGQPFDQVWHEIWDRDLKPIVQRAYAGEALHMDDIPLVMMRNGYPEQTHFSFSYTPVRGPEGGVEGFLCPCLEITEQVMQERRALVRAELTERLRAMREPDTAGLAYEAAALVGQHLGADQSAYIAIDETGEYAVVERDWNNGRMASNVGTHRLEDFGAAFIDDLRAGQSIAIRDVRDDPRTNAPEALASFEARDIRAFMTVPFLRDGRLAAVFSVHAREPRLWHPADVALVEELAERTTSALEGVRAEQARRESEERLRHARDTLALATEASQLGWGTWDFPTGEATADARLREIYGLDVEERRIDDWFARIHPDDRAAMQEEVAACMREGRPFDLGYRVLHRDGTLRHVHGTGVVRTDAEGQPLHGAGFVRDVTETVRAQERQNMLMAELDHRVKNILAVVQSIARQTLGRGRLPGPEAASRLIGRIDALARSHTLLASSRWEGARFTDLVESAVAPYRGDRGDRIELQGPDIRVRPKAAQTLTLALHELVTNAAKYGALSRAEGRATARWHVDTTGEEGRMVFDWEERGGPRIDAPPEQKGFGALLLERTLAYDLDGGVTLDFAPAGLRARVELSLDKLRAGEGQLAPDAPPPAPRRAKPGTAVKGKRVLVVEDEYLVGQETAAALEDAGCALLGPVPSLEEAVRIAASEDFAVAVLDVNLNGKLVWPAARALQARGIPFVFATGYSGTIDCPPEFSAAPWIEKPLDAEGLVSALATALSHRGS